MTSIIKKIKHLLLICSIFAIGTIFTNATYIKETTPPTEDDYYKIIRVPIPEGIVLEVGGLATMPNGQVAVSTRRGEVWVVDNPSAPMPTFRLFATGLHEILGLAYKNASIVSAVRFSSRLIDGIEIRFLSNSMASVVCVANSIDCSVCMLLIMNCVNSDTIFSQQG